MPRKVLDLASYFWEHIDRHGPDECWPWTGTTNGNGYGRIYVGGAPETMAHRLAYVLAVGPIPPGHECCHTCDNPPCCNPSHLFTGTKSDNQRDSVAKRRHTFAKRTHCAQGHPYDEENTHYRTYENGRRCRACSREWTRRWRTKQ